MGIKLTREQLAGLPPSVQAQLAAAGAGGRRPGSWSAAAPTWCPCGRRHASRMERRVCLELQQLAAARKGYLLQQVRWPLLHLAGGRGGAAAYLTVDFVLVLPAGLEGREEGPSWLAVDAKGARVSRDWARGARAWRAWYGRDRLVEWDGRGTVDTPLGRLTGAAAYTGAAGTSRPQVRQASRTSAHTGS